MTSFAQLRYSHRAISIIIVTRVSEDILIELKSLVGVAVQHSRADDGHDHETDSALCLFLNKTIGLSEAF